MISIRTFAKSAAMIAVFGMQIPMVSADVIPVSQSTHSPIVDVALTAGVLHGQFIGSTGHGIAKKNVELHAAGQHVSSAKTQQNGTFEFSEVKTGLYEVTGLNQTLLIRTWNQDVAPPHAKTFLLITEGNILRGQGTASPLAQIGLLTATGAAIGVGVSEANKDTNKPKSP